MITKKTIGDEEFWSCVNTSEQMTESLPVHQNSKMSPTKKNNTVQKTSLKDQSDASKPPTFSKGYFNFAENQKPEIRDILKEQSRNRELASAPALKFEEINCNDMVQIQTAVSESEDEKEERRRFVRNNFINCGEGRFKNANSCPQPVMLYNLVNSHNSVPENTMNEDELSNNKNDQVETIKEADFVKESQDFSTEQKKQDNISVIDQPSVEKSTTSKKPSQKIKKISKKDSKKKSVSSKSSEKNSKKIEVAKIKTPSVKKDSPKKITVKKELEEKNKNSKKINKKTVKK